MKKGKKGEQELFFVRVSNPSNLRRNILESSKEIIESLKRYENLKLIRKEKSENISKLKGDVKEIISLISKLKSKLPKVDIKEEKEAIVPNKKDFKKEAKTTELEKLESELRNIEGKLDAIS